MTSEINTTGQGQYVHANGLEIYYEEAGTGAPLILLHGGTVTGSSWLPHLPVLAQHFRAIMPDSRGQGRTDNPIGELSYRVMADDIVAFAGALGFSKPLICGFSDGGQTVLEIGMRYPDMAGALVVSGATHQFSEQYLDMLKTFSFMQSDTVDFEQMEREEPEWVVRLKTVHSRPDNPDYWQTVIKQIAVLWSTPVAYTHADLQKITAPTLLLLGDRDEGVPVEQVVEMYRTIPDAELAILPHAEHRTTGWVNAGPNPLFTDVISAFCLRHTAAQE